jgi:hypothetical protein
MEHTMPKAATSILNISEMVARYFELENAGAKLDDDDPRYDAILRDLMDLENRIVATPAVTTADLAAKQRFISKTKFAGENTRGDFATGDLAELVAAILENDAARVVPLK